MSIETRSGTQPKKDRQPDHRAHPEPSQLERFMHCKLPSAERRVVIHHLMTGCEECRNITGRLFNLGSARMLDLKTALAETPPPAPRGCRGRPGSRRAAVCMMVSTTQELLLEMAKELEAFGGRLRAALASLPPEKHADRETADVLLELRNVIGSVLSDWIAPAVADLRDAALYPNELPEEAYKDKAG